MMKRCLCFLTILLAAALPGAAQTSPPPLSSTAVMPPPRAASPKTAPRLPAAHRPPSRAAKSPKKPTTGGSWIRLNTHLMSTVGESTWVNLAQASNIRFYQTGKTAFAAVGTGGSSYVSTSDPAEILKLKAYVLAHQTR